MHIVEKSEGNPPLLKRGAKFNGMNDDMKERILKIAGETLDIEARALMDLKASLNQAFVDALSVGLRISAVIILSAAVIAWRYLPARAGERHRRSGVGEVAPDQVDGALLPSAGD